MKAIAADEARARLLGFAPLAAETVAAADADGRVLAEDARAPEDLPPVARSAMDGYAVRSADAGPRSVRAELAAGEVYAGVVGPGEAVAVATGAALPEGADAVLMLEHAARSGAAVTPARPVAPGENVVAAGADFARGATVVAAGRRLRPQDVAALVALGVGRVRVHRRPRVAVLATGSELCAPDVSPGPGQVRDVNSTALVVQARRAGCDADALGRVADDLDAVTVRVRAAADGADCVLISGGSSVGASDLTAQALAALGAEILFHGIDVRPGRPTLAARLGGVPVLGVPGPPVSALIIFEVFVRPLLWRLGGERGRDPWPARQRRPLARRVASAVGREDWLRARLCPDGCVEALPGGHALSTLVRADGLVVVPAARAALDEGEAVEVLLYV